MKCPLPRFFLLFVSLMALGICIVGCRSAAEKEFDRAIVDYENYGMTAAESRSARLYFWQNGVEAIPLLVEILEKSDDPEKQYTAASLIHYIVVVAESRQDELASTTYWDLLVRLDRAPIRGKLADRLDALNVHRRAIFVHYVNTSDGVLYPVVLAMLKYDGQLESVYGEDGEFISRISVVEKVSEILARDPSEAEN